MKCVLARAIESLQKKEIQSYSSVLFELQSLKQEVCGMTKVQHQQNSRIGNIEQQLRLLQDAKPSGFPVKDPTTDI